MLIGFKKGFTLVEIMVVVAIVGLLTAISVPIFIRTRMNANEQMVRGDLRSFSTANESYQTTQSPPAYGADIDILIEQNYLDSAWADGGRRHGYVFTYAVEGEDGGSYSILAEPAIENISGINDYCIDQRGVILVGAEGDDTGCTGGTPAASQ